MAKVLGNTAVAVIMAMNADAIQVNNFSAKVYEAALHGFTDEQVAMQRQ